MVKTLKIDNKKTWFFKPYSAACILQAAIGLVLFEYVQGCKIECIPNYLLSFLNILDIMSVKSFCFKMGKEAFNTSVIIAITFPGHA